MYVEYRMHIEIQMGTLCQRCQTFQWNVVHNVTKNVLPTFQWNVPITRRNPYRFDVRGTLDGTKNGTLHPRSTTLNCRWGGSLMTLTADDIKNDYL